MSPTETKIKLEYPITSGGVLIQEITVRRPKVKDSLAAEKAAPTAADREIRLIANLADLAPSDIEELDCSDYASIQEALRGFMSPKGEPSANPKS